MGPGVEQVSLYRAEIFRPLIFNVDKRPLAAAKGKVLQAGELEGRGPVQLGFARSIEPVLPQEMTITRVAITVEGYPILDVDTVSGGVLLHGLHIVADLALEAYIGDQAQACLRVYPGTVCLL